jgi:2'-5' RNA ligase
MEHAMRKQLTLFFYDDVVEKIRAEFNPIQYELIPAHITLCRDEEIEDIEKVLENIISINGSVPVRIEFNPPERSESGKGVLIPAKVENPEFHELRKIVLRGLPQVYNAYLPHITLMHPRNSTCTDVIFDRIIQSQLPRELFFDTISLIEQKDGGKWNVVKEFVFVSKAL